MTKFTYKLLQKRYGEINIQAKTQQDADRQYQKMFDALCSSEGELFELLNETIWENDSEEIENYDVEVEDNPL